MRVSVPRCIGILNRRGGSVLEELAEKNGIDPQDEAAVRRFDPNQPGRQPTGIIESPT